MCINCNLIAPLKHYICELLNIPYNTIGIPSSALDILSKYIIDIHIGVEYYDEFISRPELYENHVKGRPGFYTSKNIQESVIKLHNIIMEKDLFHWLKNKIIEEYKIHSINLGPCDNSIINYLLCGYFSLEKEKVTPDFFDNLNIDIKYLCDNSNLNKEYFYKIKYRQIKPIPRSYLKDKNFHKENYIIINACIYNIDLLDEPFE